MKKYFRYILVAVFFIAIMIIVFLQFNSNKNIDELIVGNEDLLQSQHIKTALHQLQKNIFKIDAETHSIIISGEKDNHRYQQLLQKQEITKNVQTDSLLLGVDSTITNSVASLKSLINRKLQFNQQLLDTFNLKGKVAAEKIINSAVGAKLSDSISILATKIDRQHEEYAKKLIAKADRDGRDAKTFGFTLAILAILVSMVTFSYVSYKMVDQRKMIAQLNMSEQKARESAIVKEHFLANMSHEIRTPLNAILGFTGLLEEKEHDADTGKYLRYIHIAGNNLLNIVNDVLDISKIEAGMITIVARPFHFIKSIEDITTVYQQKAAEKGLQFITQLSPELPQYLMGDATRLNQIITNLISNSLKFTSSGSITVKSNVKSESDSIIMVSITVSDTGIGIPQHQLKNIFDRFHQSDDAVNRKYGGAGLGLAIVKDLTKLMNGEIEVESREGYGTTFTISISFEKATIADETEVPLPPAEQAVFDLNKKILVVEDNEINQSLMKHLLAAWQINFDMEDNGEGATQRIKTSKYDLVLMDIQMPGMDGYSTTDYIRKQLLSAVPIIAMTARAMPGEKEKCLQYGMSDYISKPIDATELKKLLARYLALHTDEHDNLSHKPVGENTFQYIKTDYLKSISLGNMLYEKTVIMQFIEMVPEELKDLQSAWQQQHSSVTDIAHNLKTTVSIMGILPLVQDDLEAMEQKQLTDALFEEKFASLYLICSEAVKEAKDLLSQLYMLPH